MHRAPASSRDILKAATVKPSKHRKSSKPNPNSKKPAVKYGQQLLFSQPSSPVENTTRSAEPTSDQPVFGSQYPINQTFTFRFEFPQTAGPSEFQPPEEVQSAGRLEEKQVTETETALTSIAEMIAPSKRRVSRDDRILNVLSEGSISPFDVVLEILDENTGAIVTSFTRKRVRNSVQS